MKATERHHLKENEFAVTASKAVETIAANRHQLMLGAAVVLGLAVIGGGYWFIHSRGLAEADAALGTALAIEQSAVVPAPTLPGISQSPGTYPTEAARDEALRKALDQVAVTYPNTDAGLTARYRMAVSAMDSGRLEEADTAFLAVAASAGKSIYGPMARLGHAEVLVYSGKFDDAIKAFTDLSGERDSSVPLDGVLMQLGQAYKKAGKMQDARATFKRVVDEFPDSPFATGARQELTLLG